MPDPMISRQMGAVLQVVKPLGAFIFDPLFEARKTDPLACDFALGNPQDLPLPGFVDALQRASVPQNKDWFAYKDNEPASRAVVAGSLRAWRGIQFEPEDIFLTNGAFAGLAVSLRVLVDPGDEVIFISPPWFFYESLIVSVGGVPVRVSINPATFDLDIGAIEAAITPRTRAIIVNSPNNPTGKIYPAETLQGLAHVLNQAQEKTRRPVFIVSDEAYSRIVFDGRRYVSPTEFYPYTLLVYTYGKTLLTPGQRIGWIALPPGMPDRETMRQAVMMAQFHTGFAFPNALLQHALPDLERLSIDIPHLQEKRDRMVTALREIGYRVHSPEGTFYLLPQSPTQDDMGFARLLARRHIYVLPGITAEMPGTFRISLTASDEMIERSLPGFAEAFEEVRSRAAVPR